MEKPAISVKNLSKTYTSYKKEAGLWSSVKSLFNREKIESVAVDDINFEIQEGEFVGFLGPNGAGKTTIIKMLTGILYPTSGSMSVLGFDPSLRQEELQRRFGLVMGQKAQLWWDIPALDSFMVFKEIYDIPEKKFKRNLNDLVEMLGLGDVIKKPVRNLSLGERMKCELVASLLHDPKVLYLDEPTIGLDVVAQKNVRDFLRKYNEEKKKTIILTSHYMKDIEKLCKRIIIINHGIIIFNGSVENLKEKYGGDKLVTVYLDSDVSKKSLSKFGELLKFEPGEALIKVSASEVKNVSSEIFSSDLPITDIDITDEDVEFIIRKIFTEKMNK